MRQQIADRMQGRHTIKMMIAMPAASRSQNSRQLIGLAQRFGLKQNDLPCLMFLERLDGNAGYHCKIRDASVSETNDNLARELGQVFEICREASVRGPCEIYPADIDDDPTAFDRLVQWRRNVMNEIRPTIKSRRIFESVKTNAPTVLSGLAGVAGLL